MIFFADVSEIIAFLWVDLSSAVVSSVAEQALYDVLGHATVIVCN